MPEENFMPEKTMEALGVLKNSRGIFVSYDDPKKRESFLGSLGARLMDQHDVIYYSFYKNDLTDFVASCTEHLSNLNINGWFIAMMGKAWT